MAGVVTESFLKRQDGLRARAEQPAIHPPVMGAQGTEFPQISFSSSLGGCLHWFEQFSQQCLNSFPLLREATEL